MFQMMTAVPGIQSGGIIPVSYTHLDVYKRQPLNIVVFSVLILSGNL